MYSADIILSSLLFCVGLYGLIVGCVGLVSSELASRLGAQLAGKAPYLSMATLGLFGFVGAGALVMVFFETSLALGTGLWLGAFSLVFGVLFWLTGVAPAALYGLISRVRIRLDQRRYRYFNGQRLPIFNRRKETHDDKIENTIATAGALGVSVVVIDAVLVAMLYGVEYSSAGEVFALVCGALVLTTVFAAGALQRFDAFE